MSADREDDRLDPTLVEVGDMLAAVDPVPRELAAGADVALAWRSLDAELAALVDEEGAREPAGVRGESGVTTATFEAGDTTIAVEVTTSAGGAAVAAVAGQLVPPEAAAVTAEWPGGSLTVDADARGRFVLDAVDAGAFRLRVTREGRPPVVTDWLRA